MVARLKVGTTIGTSRHEGPHLGELITTSWRPAFPNGLEPNQAAASKDASYNDHFVLIDAHSGEILAHAEYAIVRASGKVEHGLSDGQGNTHMLSSTAEAEGIDANGQDPPAPSPRNDNA
jgi:hypothetical protein